ncbi:MAG: hypothetical protein K2N44_09420 [Lachnospiraceae bacterium]|nr:hypothetical protein [Lachnospiraceae bacterium]
MAMEINESYSRYGMNYEEQLKTKRQEKTDGAEKDKEVKNDSSEIPVQRDEYISSEASNRKQSGLYRLGQDENGNPKVLFDDPKKPVNEKPVNAEKDRISEPPEEKCTGNTDQVDREIKKLKEEKKQLEQQIKTASGDEEKIKELEKKLAQVESELSQKDNDTYRRQNSVFTEATSN